MPEKMFSREQYEQLRSFPEISRDELFRYFTLTPADAAFVDAGGRPSQVLSHRSSARCKCLMINETGQPTRTLAVTLGHHGFHGSGIAPS